MNLLAVAAALSWGFGYAIALKLPETGLGHRDLVLMHVPFNFGHTVEAVAMLDPLKKTYLPKAAALMVGTGGLSGKHHMSWSAINLLKKPGGVVWGHANPDLQTESKVTGCPMYFTPPKYWPNDLAHKYFGNKTVFGMLRDPYERLVALFRGNFKGYGGNYAELHDKCDVNTAVRGMMESYLKGNQFKDGCTFVPQAEYFEGQYGIKLPIDNRKFPDSMNQVFAQHGYSDMHITTASIFHVNGCDDSWSGDLDPTTRQLVRKVYARDFELLCKHFGYCDVEENTCIKGVPNMCPSQGKMLASRVKKHQHP